MNRTAVPNSVGHRALAGWLLVLAAGIWLRFWQLDLQLLIDDEWHALHRLMNAGYERIFLSFGHADYCIPLTLLFRFLAETVGLTEWRLRALPMAAGLATLMVVPVLLRRWLDAGERLTLGALIALSPLLIHFARYVRPYALIVLLGVIAMLVLWQWWRHGGRGRALAFFGCAVLAAWLHPLTALYAGAALSWFGIASLHHWYQHGSARRLGRVVLLGGATTLACCVLILPPLLTDPHSILVKAGKHSITSGTLARSWEMVLGTGSPWVAGLLTVPVLLGAWLLWRRDRLFMLYWLWLTLAAAVAIGLIGPEWVQNALVLVRYTAISVPLVLACLAVGLVALLRALRARLPLPGIGAFGGLACLAGLYLAGPLPATYSGVNSFTNSVRYQVDYDFERSIFRSVMGDLAVPEAYRRMAAEPGDWEIVEAAWHFETHHTPISQYQRFHQMPVRIGMISGLCTDWTYGEIHPDWSGRIRLDRFVFLSELLASPSPVDRFVVFHRRLAFDYSRELPDTGPCVAAFRRHFGAPWYEDADQIVFRIPAAGRAGGA